MALYADLPCVASLRRFDPRPCHPGGRAHPLAVFVAAAPPFRGSRRSDRIGIAVYGYLFSSKYLFRLGSSCPATPAGSFGHTLDRLFSSGAQTTLPGGRLLSVRSR